MNPAHKQFIQDMQNAGLELQTYEGRWFWKGPAVVVDQLQDAMQETKVRLKWDNLGLGYIVHPVESCSTQEEYLEICDLLEPEN